MPSRIVPTLVLAGLLLSLATGSADARSVPREFRGHERQVLPVIVVHGLTLADLPALAPDGAIGLLVPNAGPRASSSLALAGIVRGVLHNARLGPRPDGPVLIHVEKSRSIPLTRNVIVLGLPPSRTTRNGRRYPIALLGTCRGILRSSLTRVPGLVSAADVARTALASPHALRCRRDPRALSALLRLERRIETARATTMPGLLIVLFAILGLMLLAPAAALPALASALAANLALGLVPGGSASARLAVLALCILSGGLLGRRLFLRPLAAGVLLTGIVAAYAGAMTVRPSGLSLAPLSPELTSRFYGVSNLLETLLLVPALAGAAIAGRRFGRVAFAAVAALGIVTVAENRLGDDGGGAVVLGVGYAVLAVLLARGGRRALALALAAAAGAVVLLLNLDAAISGPDHLRGALAGGLSSLASVAAHRVPLAYARLATQWYLVFPLGAIALVLLRVRCERRPVALALGAALAASLLVNDSPGPVTLAGLASLVALEAPLVRRELLALLPRPLVPSRARA